MTVPERRRALQAFEVVAYVERGGQPVDERMTIELRGSPTETAGSRTWTTRCHPIKSWPSKSRPSTPPPGSTSRTWLDERIAAWTAKYADTKIVIEPIKLSDKDKNAAEAIFGSLERTERKREGKRSRRRRPPRKPVADVTVGP